mmetsp:Transcript_90890/g.196689  ORF Transcript_90890/g.196689 Transcript_90890/m.196689 type:complete len:215 (-) Transcript_90890:38-682(-)
MQEAKDPHRQAPEWREMPARAPRETEAPPGAPRERPGLARVERRQPRQHARPPQHLPGLRGGGRVEHVRRRRGFAHAGRGLVESPDQQQAAEELGAQRSADYDYDGVSLGRDCPGRPSRRGHADRPRGLHSRVVEELGEGERAEEEGRGGQARDLEGRPRDPSAAEFAEACDHPERAARPFHRLAVDEAEQPCAPVRRERTAVGLCGLAQTAPR